MASLKCGDARRRRAAAVCLAWAVGAVTCGTLAHAQTFTWNGSGGAPFNWGTGGNWSGGFAPPVNGSADLVFSGFVGASNVINVPYSVRSVTFNTAFPFPVSWSVSGSPLTLGSGGLQHLSGSPGTVSASFVLSAPATFQTTAANLNLLTGSNSLALGGFALTLSPSSGRSLTVQHAITGTGSLNLSGSGTVNITGSLSNTYTGPVFVNAGTLVLQRSSVGSALNNFGTAITGNLTIGSATVRIALGDQIADSATVTLTGVSSRLVLENVVDGAALVRLAAGSVVSATGGGTLSSYTRPGSVAMTGSSGTATVSARWDGFTNASTFSAPAGGTLAFTGEFIQEAPVTKTGGGLLRIGGLGVPVTLTSTLDVREGAARVEFPGSGSLTGVTVGATGGTTIGSLELVGDAPFGLAAVPVAVHRNSALTLTPASTNAYTFRTSSLLLHASSALTLPGNATWAPGGTSSLVGDVGGPSGEVFLTPPITSVAATGAVFDVSFAAPATAIDISATLFTRLVGGPLTKSGPGWMVANLSPNSLLPSVNVTAGRLDVNGSAWLGASGTLSVASGSLSVFGPLTTPNSPMRLSVSAGGSFTSTDMPLQQVSSLTLNSGTIKLLGSSSLVVTGTATGSFGTSTIVTTSGSVAAGVPSISGPIAATTPSVILTRNYTYFDVQPLTGGTAAYDFVLTALVARDPGAATTTYLSKLGPGNMLWQADDFTPSIFVPVEVNQGTLALRDPTPGTPTRGGVNMSRGGLLDIGPGLLTPAASLHAYNRGQVLLRSDATVNVVDVAGGTVSSTGGTLTVNSVLFLSSFTGDPAGLPLLDADSRLAPGAQFLIQANDGVSPQTALLTRRFVDTPGTVMTLTGQPPPAGISLRVIDPLAGTPANLPGPAFPGPVQVTGGFNLILERATSTPANPTTAFGVTVTGTGSTLTVARPHQLAPGSTVVLRGRATLALTPPAPTSDPVRILDGVALDLSGTTPSVVTLATPTANAASGRTAPPVVAVLSSLSVAGTAAPLGSRAYFGRVDLGTNDMVVRGGSLADLRDLARAGLASAGTAGIVTTAGVPHARVAVVPNATASGFARFLSFDGVPVSAADVLLKFTYAGDTDLNGLLDARDFNAVLNGWSNGLAGWENGDINYDNVIDATDWGLFLAAYAAGLPSMGSPLDFGTDPGAAIPEPAALAPAALLAPALLRRRRPPTTNPR